MLGKAFVVRVVAAAAVGIPFEGVFVRVFVHAGVRVDVFFGGRVVSFSGEFAFFALDWGAGVSAFGWCFEEADDAGVAVVEDVVCVTYEFPAKPEGFFVA